MRILTWNIHKGFAAGGRRFTLPAMRRALERTGADLVLLQEVQGRHDRHAAAVPGWPDQAQGAFLAGAHWAFHVYGANATHRHGHHGNALLSRFPLGDWRNHDVSNHRWERRGILEAAVQAPGGGLRVLVAHFDLTAWGRLRQAARLEILLGAPGPVVVAGDFNDWRQRLGPALEDLGLVDAHRAVHGRRARSFPARLPILPLDRLYVRGLRPVSAQVLTGAPWNALSDHAPLLVEAELSGSG